MSCGFYLNGLLSLLSLKITASIHTAIKNYSLSMIKNDKIKAKQVQRKPGLMISGCNMRCYSMKRHFYQNEKYAPCKELGGTILKIRPSQIIGIISLLIILGFGIKGLLG